MTKEDLDRLEQIASNASPGPWRWQHGSAHDLAEERNYHFIYCKDTGNGVASTYHHGPMGTIPTRNGVEADAIFISTSRQAIPDLINYCRELQGIINDMTEESDQARLAMRYREGLLEILTIASAWAGGALGDRAYSANWVAGKVGEVLYGKR